eukprot:jgi/Chlat1/5059/Chrsp33S05061
MDDTHSFKEFPSVAYWKDFKADIERAGDVQRELADLVRTSDWTGRLYWAYHSARTLFFISQYLVGSQITGRDYDYRYGITHALQLFKQDYANIKAGYYKLPWDMNLRHRQLNPLFVVRNIARLVSSAVGANRIMQSKKRKDLWIDSNLYPDYYLHNFHFQPDGWFSSDSAAAYEYQTELVFAGMQDSMQRHTLIPVTNYIKEERMVPGKMKLLDVACGTGRFLTFARDNYPDMLVTALDLSAYYLEKARDNMKYWASFTNNEDRGKSDYVQAPAEKLPFPDNSYDVITNIYLFHEIPAEAHRAAVKEMFRVVKPGGLVVITDALQEGDRVHMLKMANAWFADNFNEPHHLNYTQTDLGKLFKEAGFECGEKHLEWVSKTLSFRKPMH